MMPKKIILFLIGILLTGCHTTSLAAVRTTTSSGKKYTELNNIAPYFSMTTSQPSSDRIRLKNQWHTLEFETDSRRCWINGAMLWLNNPVRRIGHSWAIEADDFNKTVDPALRPYLYLKKMGNRTVVIDPGHGGKDLGASSPRKVHEKLLVLDISKRVAKHLQAKGVKVRLTRENNDTTLSLPERSKKAASWKADAFVSIHADSAGSNRTANGAGTFILSLAGQYSTGSYGQGAAPTTRNPGNRFDLANVALGTRIQQNLIKSTGQSDRGVKRARFQVLKEAPCPAVLIETAFLSNPKEESLVLQASFREKVARGISDGILAYLYDVGRAKK